MTAFLAFLSQPWVQAALYSIVGGSVLVDQWPRIKQLNIPLPAFLKRKTGTVDTEGHDLRECLLFIRHKVSEMPSGEGRSSALELCDAMDNLSKHLLEAK
jgi:hypothetical protein